MKRAIVYTLSFLVGVFFLLMYVLVRHEAKVVESWYEEEPLGI